MNFSDASPWFFIPLQILLVDLMLGADNALVIALACRALPPRQVNQAAAIGVGAAIVLRLLLAVVATSLLTLPLVKIVGAIALIFIALNLASGRALGPDMVDEGPATRSLLSAAAVIVIADAAMSVDNIVALAAIAAGNFWWLAIGVALSLPVLGFGGVMLSRLLRHAHALVELGAALLGWIAGGMALTDPLVFPWADVNAPGLVALAPALGAAFVFLYGRLVAREAPAQAPKPRRAEKPGQMLEVEAPILRFESAPDVDATPEPVDIHEPDPAPAVREDRIAIIGLLLLAIAAGAIIMIASYLDSFN